AQVVSERYFETLATPILRGRAFTARDNANAPPVAIINERMARRFWPNEDALGKHLRIGPPAAPLCEIIGVAEDTLHALGEEPQLTTYRPLAQQPADQLTVALHTANAPQTLIAGVRREVLALDPNLPLEDVKTLDEAVGLQFWPARMCAALLGGFGLLGLLLAAVGIYGVMSYAVTERTREIGVRMALGAAPRDVLRLVIRQGLWLTLLGTGVGLLLAFAATRLLASMLYGVGVRDPLTFIGVPLLLGTVALLACWIPAWRATRVDPLIALRSE
ncbi:MAG: FtsX-like permease family protein, partial [Blastocatellia bacterium]